MDRQQARLTLLKQKKQEHFYCSVCAKRLKFASFTSHPCYKDAVKKVGKYRARQTIRRLRTPPKIRVLVQDEEWSDTPDDD